MEKKFIVSENTEYGNAGQECVLVDTASVIEDNNLWQNLCNKMFPVDNDGNTIYNTPLSLAGTVTMEDTDLLYFSTRHGDGYYDGVAVDSGTICVLSKENFDRLQNISDFKLNDDMYKVLTLEDTVVADRKGNLLYKNGKEVLCT